MKYQVIAFVLIATMSMGFSFGSKKEKSSSSAAGTAASVQTQAAQATDTAYKTVKQTETDVKNKVDSYSSYGMDKGMSDAKTASKAVSSKAVSNAASGEEFPTELVSQLASGDEQARKARMESLRRLSQALGQMNAAAPAAQSKSSDSKKK